MDSWCSVSAPSRRGPRGMVGAPAPLRSGDRGDASVGPVGDGAQERASPEPGPKGVTRREGDDALSSRRVSGLITCRIA